MSQAVGGIICAGCSRSYKWKPEFAGKKAKCKCGSSVAFPAADPTASAPSLDPLGEYDLRESEPPPAAKAPPPPPPTPAGKSGKRGTGPACKGCQAPLASGAVLCTSCGMNQKTGKKLGTAVEKTTVSTIAANPNMEKKPAAAGLPKWAWIAIGAGVLVVAILVAMFALPKELAEKTFLGVAIAGGVIYALSWWLAIYQITQDNLGLRLACRFIPFIALFVLIKACISDWHSVKALVFGIITGIGIGALGLILYLGHAVAHAA